MYQPFRGKSLNLKSQTGEHTFNVKKPEIGDKNCFHFTKKETVNFFLFFTITAEIHTRSLANFYCQHADRHEFEIQATHQ